MQESYVWDAERDFGTEQKEESKAALLLLFSIHTDREEQQLSTFQNGCQ